MTKVRLPPSAAPLTPAERETEYQRAAELAFTPGARSVQPTFVSRIRKLVAPPASVRTAETYAREIAWRPLLSVRGLAGDDAPQAPAPRPAGFRAMFVAGGTRRRSGPR